MFSWVMVILACLNSETTERKQLTNHPTFDSDKGNHQNFKFHSQKHQLDKRQFQIVHFQNEGKQLISIQPQKSKFVAEEKQSSGIQKIPGKIKLKGGSKFFQKFGKKVAAATIGDYLVNIDLWTTSLFEQHTVLTINTNMLNSSSCLDFPNDKCMHFNH